MSETCQGLCHRKSKPIADSVSQITQQVSALRTELQAKYAAIADLKEEIYKIQIKNDHLEQHGRRSSIRVSGIPVGDHDDTDAKLMSLINNELKIDPTLCQTGIITTHRVPFRNAYPTDPPLIKFESTSTKNRVMKTRAVLRDYRRTNERKVYFTEDLTALLGGRNCFIRHAKSNWTNSSLIAGRIMGTLKTRTNCHYHYVYLYTHSIYWYSKGSAENNIKYFLVNNCSISDHDNATGMIFYDSQSIVNQKRSTLMPCLSMDFICQ